MARRSKRSQLDRSRSREYLRVADSFYRGAEVAREFEYWNAAGGLADAVTIQTGGVKSRGLDHGDVVDLIQETVALDDLGRKAVTRLRRLIDEKNLVSSSGEVYTRKDITRLARLLEPFRTWSLTILGS